MVEAGLVCKKKYTHNMIQQLKYRLFNGWHAMRWIALAIGLFIGYQAVVYQDIISGFLAAFFLYQAATNRGCLVGFCATDTNATDSDVDDIEFTKIENQS